MRKNRVVYVFGDKSSPIEYLSGKGILIEKTELTKEVFESLIDRGHIVMLSYPPQQSVTHIKWALKVEAHIGEAYIKQIELVKKTELSVKIGEKNGCSDVVAVGVPELNELSNKGLKIHRLHVPLTGIIDRDSLMSKGDLLCYLRLLKLPFKFLTTTVKLINYGNDEKTVFKRTEDQFENTKKIKGLQSLSHYDMESHAELTLGTMDSCYSAIEEGYYIKNLLPLIPSIMKYIQQVPKSKFLEEIELKLRELPSTKRLLYSDISKKLLASDLRSLFRDSFRYLKPTEFDMASTLCRIITNKEEFNSNIDFHLRNGGQTEELDVQKLIFLQQKRDVIKLLKTDVDRLVKEKLELLRDENYQVTKDDARLLSYDGHPELGGKTLPVSVDTIDAKLTAYQQLICSIKTSNVSESVQSVVEKAQKR